MVSIEIYKPEQWHDVFLLVGTGAVTLTGLIFVALTIHLKSITQDQVHRSRAFSALTGLTVIFLQCATALLPDQTHTKLGVELIILAIFAGAVFTSGVIRNYLSATHSDTYSPPRAVTGIVLYLAETAGAILLTAGHIFGLYVFVVGIFANLLFMVTGAWILVVGPVTES